MFKSVFSDNRGFSLLELMMSMVIMAIAFVGILPFFFYSQAQIKNAILTNYAMNIIQSKMEEISKLDWDLITYDDNVSDLALAYVFVLPEVNVRPCTTFPSAVCGFDTSINMLRDVVVEDGYYFTRIIDIDQPDDPDSLDDANDLTDTPLPLNGITKRVTIRVSWTIPGNKTEFVQATTEFADIETPAVIG